MRRYFFLSALFASMLHASVDLSQYIETIPDFPKRGINFKWYPRLLKDPDAFSSVISDLKERYKNKNIDAICGLDSRGFVFGSALAYEMKLPFVMIRKKGKLPKQTHSIDYALEYGTASFEIELDSLKKNDRVIIIDDILATGGTALAAIKLVENLGAHVVEVSCLLELVGLGGKEKIPCPFYAVDVQNCD